MITPLFALRHFPKRCCKYTPDRAFGLISGILRARAERTPASTGR